MKLIGDIRSLLTSNDTVYSLDDISTNQELWQTIVAESSDLTNETLSDCIVKNQ